jgi:flagellar protein FlaG
MPTDAFVSIATSIAPSLVQSVATKAGATNGNDTESSATNVPAPAPAKAAVVTQQQLQEAVQQIQKYITESKRTLEFRIDQDSGKPVVSVRDADGNLIRQIPNEETLHIAQMIKDQGALNHGLLNLTV